MVLGKEAVFSEICVLPGIERFTNTPPPAVVYSWVPCRILHDPDVGPS